MMKTHQSIYRVGSDSFILAALLIHLAIVGAMAEPFTVDTALMAAAKGDARAQYYLAKHYAKGDGVPQDYAKTADYMRQAADQGFAYAQNDLGVLYARGQGVKQDYQIAAQWYLKAAENGDSLGQYSIGLAYSLGRGVPRNLPMAIDWLKKSAQQNQPDALLALGDIYFQGRPGLIRDYQEARKWLEMAVACGRVDALNSLGVIYELGGFGVDKNPEQAVKCFRHAAEKNDDQGQMNLGRMYRDGSGVKRDRIEAYKWFYLAMNHGNGIARHYLMELTGESPLVAGPLLTQSQIDEGVKRAQDFEKSLGNETSK